MKNLVFNNNLIGRVHRILGFYLFVFVYAFVSFHEKTNEKCVLFLLPLFFQASTKISRERKILTEVEVVS